TEKRRHQRVRIELAAESEPLAALPGLPDRAQRAHELAHARVGTRPGLAETLLDVRPDLRAEAEDESAARQELEVVGRVRAHHRIAREGDGNCGHELDTLGALCRRDELQEGVVLALEAEHPVEPLLFERPRMRTDVRQVPEERPVELHRRTWLSPRGSRDA